ncbi:MULTISPECIES: ATP-binding cassette domain-containing protein [Mammaliicoccus]|uniref:ATP-binding cassette domain-containing protein n=1 Tax=Mammaliicoccus fleurettii TaxID=150056 RepID=A0ABS5MPL5_9STAP|nr:MULTISPECIES: ATP-binding cassette domain-containing protein [Mammaliicoccus]HCN59470.1 metal ABC transporter ATP-binding protein [Staphylococcus sp.]MBL0848045.1 ATP-binding cassette domain-containing protein [Mammaliicoccus fleurettii]MBO3063589.1 ATP-binding cassette domain-containing protein [Mammaliicoccus fleurettii]MBS3672041.1 ATP-binding cassette domain-containing protein [Mammaliicoccus fleurettii]MBS3697789.1 ATP-binding cassette domain-containing protein [Mammaliicoccus fleurett
MYKLENVSKKYNDKFAVKNFSLTVEPGSITGIVGKSGSGKSTLLKMLNFIEQPTEGEIIFEDKEINHVSKKIIRKYKEKIGMVFQNYNLLNNLNVYQNIALPLKIINKEDKHKVNELIEFVGLEDKINSYPAQLSGGEKQRVALARSLVRNPDILLCDEATSSLDEHNTEIIIKMLKNINKEFNITIIFVTHELNVVKQLCEQVCVMEDGQLLDIIENRTKSVEQDTGSYLENVKRSIEE